MKLGFLKRSSPARLGEVLVREKIITRDQLRQALEIQKNEPLRLGQIVVEQGFASEVEVLQAIAKEYSISMDSLKDNIGELVQRRKQPLLEKITDARIPIRAKLSIAITFIIWLTILTLSFVILARQKNSLYEQTMKTGKISLNYFVSDAAVPLLENDIVRLNSLIREASSVEGLLFASIVDRDGTIKAHSDASLIGAQRDTLPEEAETSRSGNMAYFSTRLPTGTHALILSRPVTFSGVDLGEALVGVSLDFIDGEIRRESLNIIILSFFIVLLGIAIAVQIGVGFSRPISELVVATHEIGKGNFKHRIQKISRDEFGDLAAAFNYMSQELWKKLKMQKSFGSYVSPEILEMIMDQPEGDWLRGKRMDVTVLFTDIRGFTKYTEDHEPERVVESVNTYFQIATRHIQVHGGYIDKFIGDAVLGVFGAPLALSDHAHRAVRAAAAMQREFREKADGANPLLERVGIGINTGEAVAGDLGSEAKKEYSIIGDCVNLASRLNSLAAEGQTIISSSTYEAAREILEAKPLGSMKVKGKAHEVDTFELLSVRGGEPQEGAETGPTGKQDGQGLF